ncbi:MAG: hypothetical protein IKP62_08520 [Salinivirgaceae bacterium]|nr:hypothetical protein [Salinivirgaceae bacterium]
MKNLFKLGFAVSLMAACVFSGCSKNDDEPGVDYSKKRVLSESMVIKDSEGGTWTSKSEYKYDSRGNMIENKHTTVDNSGTVTENKFETKFNEQGDVTEQLLNGQTISKSDYTYDVNSTKRTVHHYSDGNETSTYYVEEYADAPHKKLLSSITSETKNADGSTQSFSKVVYSYDKDGNVINYESFDGNGQLIRKIERVYNGNVENSTQYEYADDSVVNTIQTKTVYTDSNREKILTQESTKPSGNKHKIENTYDMNGNVIETVEYENDHLQYKSTEYVYDGNTLTYTKYTYGFYNGDGFTPTEEPTSTTYYTIVYE